MGYLRPVQAVNKPHSFEVDADVTFERGAFLWLNPVTGKATNVYDATYLPLGLADDDKVSSVTQRIIDQVLTGSAAVAAASGTATIATGRTIPTAYQLTSADITDLPTWKFEVYLSNVWTEFASGGAITKANAFGGTLTGIAISLSSTGDVTVVLASSGSNMTPATYSIRVTMDYVANKASSGSNLITDMFSSDSTAASSLVTVWFMDGIMESDQYDPYVAWTVGDTVYAKTGGVLTNVETNATSVGKLLKVPEATFTAETKTTSGHSIPKPEVIRFMYRLA